MSRILFTGAFAALSLALAAAPAAAEIVYEQAGTDAACAGACWTSSFGDGVGFRTFDNFTVTADAGINYASWRGFIQSASGTEAVDPAVASWNVSFSQDGGGQPGAVIYSRSFAAADVTTTFLGVSTFSGPVNVYEFSVVIPTFFASAGTTYWFSPFASQEHFYPFFSWSPSAPGNSGSSFQVALPGGQTSERFGDRAFALGAVPEPGTWALMIVGFGASGALLRRRRGVASAA